MADFNNDISKFHKYQAKFPKTLSLYLDGISTLLSDKVFEGHICFKVSNLEFSPVQPLELQGVKIYNPQNYKLAIQKRHKKWEIENFYLDDSENEKLFKTKSTCNVITKIKLRYPITDLEQRRAVIEAKDKCQHSLNFLLDTYNIKTFGEIEVRPQYSFLINNRDEIGSYSLGIFYQNNSSTFEIDKAVEPYRTNAIRSYNRLERTIPLHKKLLQLIHLNNKYRLQPNRFSFKEYWNTWELFGDLKSIKRLVKLCYSNHDKINYLGSIILLLNNYLKIPWYGENRKIISLGKEDLKKYGIEVQAFQIIKTKKFSKCYEKLFDKVNFRFLEIIQKRTKVFLSKPKEHKAKTDKWIENAFLELKNERNIETHQNNLNEITHLKLKQDLLMISDVFISTILRNMTLHNKSDIEKIENRIKNKTD